MQPALQDEPRRSRGALGLSLTENQQKTKPNKLRPDCLSGTQTNLRPDCLQVPSPLCRLLLLFKIDLGRGAAEAKRKPPVQGSLPNKCRVRARSGSFLTGLAKFHMCQCFPLVWPGLTSSILPSPPFLLGRRWPQGPPQTPEKSTIFTRGNKDEKNRKC